MVARVVVGLLEIRIAQILIFVVHNGDGAGPSQLDTVMATMQCKRMYLAVAMSSVTEFVKTPLCVVPSMDTVELQRLVTAMALTQCRHQMTLQPILLLLNRLLHRLCLFFHPMAPSAMARILVLIAYLGNWDACPTDQQLEQYTHIMIAFAVSYQWSSPKVQCSPTCEISSPLVCENAARPDLIQKWQADGKKVILSFGGALMGGSWASSVDDCWEYCYGRETQVVDRLVDIANEMGVDGVDIDYEYYYDDGQNGSGFSRGSEAQKFLKDVTLGLREKLPRGSEVTHAPMDTDLVPGKGYYNVLKEVAPSVDFLMPQYYNGVIYAKTDFNGAAQHFEQLQNDVFGGDASKIVFGFCINQCGVYNMDGIQAASTMEKLNENFPCNGGAFFWMASHDVNAAWSIPVANEIQSGSDQCLVNDPTVSPTVSPTAELSANPSGSPSLGPTTSPTTTPSEAPTASPTRDPTASPTTSPTGAPTSSPTGDPTASPSVFPTTAPTVEVTPDPTTSPTTFPSGAPTLSPTSSPSGAPTTSPTTGVTANPTTSPTTNPSWGPTSSKTVDVSAGPTTSPTTIPSGSPTASPTPSPTVDVSAGPTISPTKNPSGLPTAWPTLRRSGVQTASPTAGPTDFEFVPIGPDECPEDMLLIGHVGITTYQEDTVRIVSQDQTAVTVELRQTYTDSDSAIDNLYYQYHKNRFDNKCYEEQALAGDTYLEITIQCTVNSQIGLLELWIADDISNGVLSQGDNAIIPNCCHPSVSDGTPVIKYIVEIKCNTACPGVSG